MKNLFFLLALLGSISGIIAQPALTIGLTTTFVETSTRSIAYPTSDLYFKYMPESGKFKAYEVFSQNLVYDALIGTVEIDTFTTAANKLLALTVTHAEAGTDASGYTYLPMNSVSIRQRYPNVEVWPAYGPAKNAIWSGKADDLGLSTAEYYSAPADKCLETSVAISSANATFSAGASAGTAASISGSFGNNLAGHIYLTIGSGSVSSSGTLCTITLPREFPDGFFVQLTPRTAATATAYAGGLVFAGFGPLATKQFTLTASTTAISTGTVLRFDYQIVGYRD